MGLLLLLLLLFLLSPLSCYASHLDQEKSYGSSVVAPVQELHQLIIGEVKTILPIDLQTDKDLVGIPSKKISPAKIHSHTRDTDYRHQPLSLVWEWISTGEIFLDRMPT